jgi:hypothetical protein
MASPGIILCLSAPGLEPWQSRCLRRLKEVTGADVSAVISPSAPFASWPQDLPQPQWLASAERLPIASPGDAPPVLVLDLCETPEPQRLASAARFGSWWMEWGETGAYNDAGIAELWARRRAIGARLLQRTREGGVAVVESGFVKAVSHSLRATRARLFDMAAEWPARGLSRFLNHIGPIPASGSRPPASPGPLPAWRRRLLPAVLLRNILARLADESIEEHWTIGVIEGDIENLVSGFDMKAVNWLPELPGGYLADPFVLQKDGKTTILAEAYRYTDRHGVIVALTRDAGGGMSSPQEALRLESHCSYPQIIEHESALYMVPENAREGCVRLYRAAPFPTTWVPDRVLIKGFAGVDSTLFRHDERWWLLATDFHDQDDTKLYAFHAEDLFGPWHAHRLNPVKNDLASARPAGVPFRAGGRLLRPVQDCTRCYGGALVLNHLAHLTPDTFLEEPVTVIRPDVMGPYPDGIHTLNGANGVTVIDGKRHSRSWRCLMAGLARLARESTGR